MLGLNKLSQLKDSITKKFTHDSSWHNGIYQPGNDKEYTYDELVVGEKYILALIDPRKTKIFRYKAVILTKKWKDDHWYSHACHVKVCSTWNDSEFPHTLSPYGPAKMYQWRDIDADRKK